MSRRQNSMREPEDSSDPYRKPELIVNGMPVRNPKVSLAEQLAGTPFYIRNWKWHGAVEDFPNEPWLRCVDKFYPKAQMGPLAVDEPDLPQDMVACERKAKFMKKRNIRYLILKPGMSLQEAQVELSKNEAKVD